MSIAEPLDSPGGLHIHLVGAKGTGVAALAEILVSGGAVVSGADVAEVFYTDAILSELGVAMGVGFEASGLPDGLDLVIHSAAYSRETNPQLLEAARRGVRIMSYPEALGALSAGRDSSGIAGVHGKTTTTALAGSLASALGLPATVLAGSAVTSFGGRSTLVLGDRFLVAETCEYRRHFLNFKPRRIVLTSVESDHQDYYPTYADIRDAFLEYVLSLPPGGGLIYCADDPGASETAGLASRARSDLVLTPYGRSAPGPYRLESYLTGEGRAGFRLAGFDLEFELRVPGEHVALDATAALALVLALLAERGKSGGPAPTELRPTAAELGAAKAALAAFAGSKRRSEILGEAGGVLFMDDYGHHPTAIRETIRGVKAFWPSRRLVVDFMSHTASRTKALFEEFAASLDGADELILHGIYPSAREAPDPSVSGEMLYRRVAALRRGRGLPGEAAPGEGGVSYFEKPLDAAGAAARGLRPGDLFLTMGAGDNWRLGAELLARRRAAAEGAGR